VEDFDYMIVANSTDTSQFTVILPEYPREGRKVEIKEGTGKQDASITVSGNGRPVDGSPTFTMRGPSVSFIVTFVGSEWRVS
jgi:hypothetical protein